MALLEDTTDTLSAALASALAAHTSDFVGVIDEEGVALYMNRSARGAATSDVEGKPLEAFLSPSRAKRIRAMASEARRLGQPVVEEAVRIDALDNTERWFIEKCVPFREADGALRFLLVRTEITRLRRANEELRALEARYQTLFESNPDPVVVVDVTSLRIVAAKKPTRPVGRHACTMGLVGSPWPNRKSLALSEPSHGQSAPSSSVAAAGSKGASRTATPVPGLYLCGAGTHPCGGATGTNGRIAAEAVLSHLGQVT